MREWITKWIRVRYILSAIWLFVVAGLTLEIAARLDDLVHYGAPLTGRYEFDQLFRLTDRGFRGVPLSRFMRWNLNSDGVRGPEARPYTGQIRVVVYGASEAFGMYEDNGKEYPRVLERELNAGTSPGHFEVVNAAIPGMRVGSGVSFLRDLQERWHAQVLIIYPTPTHYIGVSQPICGRPPQPVPTQTTPYQGLRITSKIAEIAKRVAPRAIMTLLRKRSIDREMHGREPLAHVQQVSLEALEVDLRCTIATARDLGMTPILLTHANRFGDVSHPDDADWLTQWRKQYPEMREDGFVDLENQANAAIRKAAVDNRTLLVDATSVLSGHSEWFADHAHFTNQGAAQMGALLAPAVLAAVAGDPLRQ